MSSPFHRWGPLAWCVLAALTLAADYITGPLIRFPILYLLPIGLAAWHNGKGWGLCMAILMPLARVYLVALWPDNHRLFETLVNALIEMGVMVFIAFLVSRTARQTELLSRQVQRLEGLLPICSFCKRIRNDHEQWESLEGYIGKRSKAQFSHGCCPECAKIHYPGLLD